MEYNVTRSTHQKPRTGVCNPRRGSIYLSVSLRAGKVLMTGLLIGHIYITEQSRKAPEVALALFWTSKLDILHLKKKKQKMQRGKAMFARLFFFSGM